MVFCAVGTQAALGIAPPSEALLFVICSPVGPYYPQGFKPVALYGTTEYSRAAPGGKFVMWRATLPRSDRRTQVLVRTSSVPTTLPVS